MAETTLQLGFVPKNRGEYQSTPVTRYYKDNVVQYNGSSYIADPVGWSESDPTATYVTIPPTDESGNLNTGWKVFASGNNTFTTGEKVDNIGIDSEPVAESDNLVKSGGVYSSKDSLDRRLGLIDGKGKIQFYVSKNHSSRDDQIEINCKNNDTITFKFKTITATLDSNVTPQLIFYNNSGSAVRHITVNELNVEQTESINTNDATHFGIYCFASAAGIVEIEFSYSSDYDKTKNSITNNKIEIDNLKNNKTFTCNLSPYFTNGKYRRPNLSISNRTLTIYQNSILFYNKTRYDFLNDLTINLSGFNSGAKIIIFDSSNNTFSCVPYNTSLTDTQGIVMTLRTNNKDGGLFTTIYDYVCSCVCLIDGKEIIGSANINTINNKVAVVDCISEQTKNLFNPEYLILQGGWEKLNGDVYRGNLQNLASAFHLNNKGYPIFSGFKANTRYTLSLEGMIETDNVSGQGPMIRFHYTDDTTSGLTIANSETSWISKKASSTADKTVDFIYITYGSNPDNIWRFRNIQLEEGATQTSFVQFSTAKDIIARNNISVLEEDVNTIQQSIEPLLTNIPSYFTEQINSVITSARKDVADAGLDGTNFVFITDMHWESNVKNSPDIIKYLCSKLSIDSIIFGGDALNGEANQDDARQIFSTIASKLNSANGRFASIVGNHDNNSADGGTRFSNNEKTFSALTQRVGYLKKFFGSDAYFYFDDVNTNTRFICLDTHAGYTIESSQITWLQSILNNADSDTHIVVVLHAYLNGTPRYNEQQQFVGYDVAPSSAGNSLNTILNDFISQKKIECVISGHMHLDYNGMTDTMIPVITSDCDARQSSMWNHNTQSINEQSFDLITINYDSKTIFCRRIGRGKSRIIHYIQYNLTIGDTLDISSLISIVPTSYSTRDNMILHTHSSASVPNKVTFENNYATIDSNGTVTAVATGLLTAVAENDDYIETFNIKIS